MLRKFLFYLATMLTICTPALAEGMVCRNTDGPRFVSRGIEAIESGRVRGAALRGDDATAFLDKAGFQASDDTLAVFLVDSGKDRILIAVGAEGLCIFFEFDAATTNAVALYFGTGI